MGVGVFFLRGFLNFPYLKYGGVYYETIQRELNRRLKYECRCDERRKTKAEGSTHSLLCDRDGKGATSIFNVIRSASVLGRMFSTLDLNCEENTTWW